MRGFSAVGLERPKCKENIGGVLRAAHCYGASLVMVQGDRIGEYRTDVTRAYKHIPCLNVDDLIQAVPVGTTPVVVEINSRARPLPTFRHPDSAFYIFGPEDGSVSQRIVDQCQLVVSIPTAHCMNLAATVNVVLYDRLAKQMTK